MVNCKCGKAIDKVPDWLQGVNVEFACNNCPNRKTKNIAFTSLEPVVVAAAAEVSDNLVVPAEVEEAVES